MALASFPFTFIQRIYNRSDPIHFLEMSWRSKRIQKFIFPILNERRRTDDDRIFMSTLH